MLKRLKFAATSERFSPEQRSLLGEAIDEDLEALAREVEKVVPAAKDSGDKRQPKRHALPPHLPRREIHHEPESTTCSCGCALKRTGEDVAEKLDYTPGTFTVERHVRGKWACTSCHTLVQAPVPAHVIDKGLATAGLLAHVSFAKYVDHQPLYRQESIFGRAGYTVPRSTQAEWIGAIGVQLAPLVQAMREDLLSRRVLHADETPVAMLMPGLGKTHRADLWSYCTTAWDEINAVVFDFAESRAGHHARRFLGLQEDGTGGWRGTLICDDYSGYKQAMAAGVTEAGCMAHARRKFHELWANHSSTLAEQSGLVHTVKGTAGNGADVVMASSLLHGEERVVFADAGYQGAEKRPDAKPGLAWLQQCGQANARRSAKAKRSLDRSRESNTRRRAFVPRSSTRFE